MQQYPFGFIPFWTLNDSLLDPWVDKDETEEQVILRRAREHSEGRLDPEEEDESFRGFLI